MNGAIPSGPNASRRIIKNPSANPCTTAGRLPNLSCIESLHRSGMKLMPNATKRIIRLNGVAWNDDPEKFIKVAKVPEAISRSVAKKTTQLSAMRWNVMNHCRYATRRYLLGAPGLMFKRNLSIKIKTPSILPQMMKFHEAPCHNPLIKKVSKSAKTVPAV